MHVGFCRDSVTSEYVVKDRGGTFGAGLGIGNAFMAIKAEACRWYFEAALYTCFVQQTESTIEFVLRISGYLLFVDLLLALAFIVIAFERRRRQKQQHIDNTVMCKTIQDDDDPLQLRSYAVAGGGGKDHICPVCNARYLTAADVALHRKRRHLEKN